VVRAFFALWMIYGSGYAASTNIFSTQFEPAQFDSARTLVGQQGWVGLNAGTTSNHFDNGLISGFFEGEGQQAYLGFAPPPVRTNQVLVWHPINYTPPSDAQVKFSVLMSIVDSTNDRYDDFNWTVYNRDGDPLFSLSFNNANTNIYYDLDGTNNNVKTGKTYQPNLLYDLEILMNFNANRWSASLDGAVLVTNKQITTTGAARDLGDLDAVWILADPNAPGNNYLAFDNYTVTAEFPDTTVIPSRIESYDRSSNGSFVMTVSGMEGRRYVVEVATGLKGTWVPLRTNTVTEASFDFIDTAAKNFTTRFYRSRLLPTSTLLEQ